ncbi:hypothetical protein NSMS1_09830 [Nostoc sp. MS1]|nr:hypothetical protein NSMS1_09830 [Nostoc sp. MS1]
MVCSKDFSPQIRTKVLTTNSITMTYLLMRNCYSATILQSKYNGGTNPPLLKTMLCRSMVRVVTLYSNKITG